MRAKIFVTLATVVISILAIQTGGFASICSTSYITEGEAATLTEYSDASDMSGTCTEYAAPQRINGANVYYYECTECDTGSHLESQTLRVSDAGNCSLTFNTCEDNCASVDCPYGAWTSNGPGYEYQVINTCDQSDGTCVDSGSKNYRCADSYYGSTTNGTSGCSPCPKIEGIQSVSNEERSDCCVSKGSTGTDEFGDFQLKNECCVND